jgi:thiol-disulfide isomerase/thioredoxin
MNRIITFAFGVFVSLIISSGCYAQKGYEINLSLKGIKDTTAILGHYLGKSMYPDDTARLNLNGQGVFKGKKTLNQGLYLIYLPNGQYFEFIMGADQQFSLLADTTDYVKSLQSDGSPDNTIFFDFQRFMLSKRPEMEKLQAELKDAKAEKDKKKVEEKIVSLNNEKIIKIKDITQKNPDLFVSTFLKATLEIEVPEDIRSNPEKSYEYFKTHFFDNFDLSDIRLLYTPLYEDKLKVYLDDVVLQIPDSLNKEIDMIIGKSRSDSSLFRFVLITLFNKYAKSQIMGMDGVQVHIADKYYIKEAWWSDAKFISDLKERVDILKPLLIGQIAPDAQLRFVPVEHFKLAANDTALKRYPHAGSFFNISQVEADYTILLFWEATCSHCKTAVPELYKIYKDSLQSMNVKVIAISTLFGEDGKEKWIDFVNKNQLYDWINAWNPYDYKFKVNYDVRSTPQIYILDKNKKIIGKKLGPEQIVGFIEMFKKHNTKE